MPALTPAALATLERAHKEACERLDAARRSVEMTADHLAHARRNHAEAARHAEELARVLDEHRAEVAAVEASRCPACGMTEGRHTGGCEARRPDAYAAARDRLQSGPGLTLTDAGPKQYAQRLPAESDAMREG